MSIHLIIDGYNLIRQSGRLSLLDRQDMKAGREALIEALAKYKKIKHHKITVVFDGANAPSFVPSRDYVKGIRIKFSRLDESADTVIKKMAAREREKAVIVTSDRDIINQAESSGSASISSLHFEEKMIMAEYMDRKGVDEEDKPGWAPTTKKKGPGRRLPKKDRRSSSKLNKL